MELIDFQVNDVVASAGCAVSQAVLRCSARACHTLCRCPRCNVTCNVEKGKREMSNIVTYWGHERKGDIICFGDGWCVCCIDFALHYDSFG